MENIFEKQDILNREDFIIRTIRLVKIVAANKGNTTFAINGEWGCGKTFVLKEIQRRLDQDSEKDFLVIPYNCWQYDYYSEPLVAIVSALLDYADTRDIIPNDMKITLKEIALKLGVGLVTQQIKNRTGIDIKEAVEQLKDIKDGAEEGIEKAHDFDEYYSFKNTLEELKKKLEELSEEYTLVFAVDELDRCLPEYAIKVLERLHHISEGVSNMITIIAVDKKRLENTVKSIFGNKDDQQDDCAGKYLKKFIRFEINLDYGKQNSPKFFDKFPDFYDRFDASLYGELNNTEQFLEELFQGIDIRSQERIVEKATILNDICFGNEKQDHSIMYMELFYATLYYHYNNKNIFSASKRVSNRKAVLVKAGNVPVVFNSEKSGFCFLDSPITSYITHNEMLVNPRDVFATVLLYWYNTPKPDRDRAVFKEDVVPKYTISNGERSCIDDNITKMRQYIDLLNTIG